MADVICRESREADRRGTTYTATIGEVDCYLARSCSARTEFLGHGPKQAVLVWIQCVCFAIRE